LQLDLVIGMSGLFGKEFPNLTWNGAIRYEVQQNAVPEPSTFAALAGLSGMGFVVLRRRRNK
jgi:hypothetical protein